MADHGVLVVGSANKGANQAVACAKLGGRTYFVGKMGKDVFRDKLLASMKKDGVRLNHIMYDPAEPTGIALITVDGRGQNTIVVVSGSNMKLLPSDLDQQKAIFACVRVVLSTGDTAANGCAGSRVSTPFWCDGHS